MWKFTLPILNLNSSSLPVCSTQPRTFPYQTILVRVLFRSCRNVMPIFQIDQLQKDERKYLCWKRKKNNPLLVLTKFNSWNSMKNHCMVLWKNETGLEYSSHIYLLYLSSFEPYFLSLHSLPPKHIHDHALPRITLFPCSESFSGDSIPVNWSP